MSERYYANWKLIFQRIKEKYPDASLRVISKELGKNFRNNVYGGYSMDESTFNKLQELYPGEFYKTLSEKESNQIENERSTDNLGPGRVVADWQSVFHGIKNAYPEATLRSISKAIEYNFRNNVYGGYSLHKYHFFKLKEEFPDAFSQLDSRGSTEGLDNNVKITPSNFTISTPSFDFPKFIEQKIVEKVAKLQKNYYAHPKNNIPPQEHLNQLMVNNGADQTRDINPMNYRELLLENMKNTRMAKLSGYFLGDGHVSRGSAEISLHDNEIQSIGKEVIALIKEQLNKKPTVHSRKNDSSTLIRINSLEASKILSDLGHIWGNKVKNQIDVPDWVKSEAKFHKPLIEGLFNSDGSIYLHKRSQSLKQRIEINFSNRSIPLLSFFHKYLLNQNYKSKIYQKYSNVYLFDRIDVHKFVQSHNLIKVENFLLQHNLSKDDITKTLISESDLSGYLQRVAENHKFRIEINNTIKTDQHNSIRIPTVEYSKKEFRELIKLIGSENVIEFSHRSDRSRNTTIKILQGENDNLG